MASTRKPINDPSEPIISSSLNKNVRIILDIMPSDPDPITTLFVLTLNFFASLLLKAKPFASGYLFKELYVFLIASIASGLGPNGFSFDDNFM